MREMQRHSEIEPILVHTGQHYDEKLSDIFFKQMGIPAPHVNLEVGSGSHAAQTAEVLKRIEPVLLSVNQIWSWVVGDVNSTIAVSSLPSNSDPGRHVEAGLRSFDRAMPEELTVSSPTPWPITLCHRRRCHPSISSKKARPREAHPLCRNVRSTHFRHFLPIAQKSPIGDVWPKNRRRLEIASPS